MAYQVLPFDNVPTMEIKIMLFRTLRPLLAADRLSFSTISPWLIDVLG